MRSEAGVREGARIWNADALEARVVRYGGLVPCTTAFIDTRTPGSNTKENFTIIGPGVAENPDQHVHIAEPHGFNIGGARQPPGCKNSQHSHDTAEVFVVHTGRWRFLFGEHGEDAQVEAAPGDIVSFPTQTFRGFENIGDDTGFLWSVLGGDDPGRVLWAPAVFHMAAEHGLVLLENGALLDMTLGQPVPDGVEVMSPTSPEAIAKLRKMQPQDEAEIIARAGSAPNDGEELEIGQGGRLPAADGFTVSRLTLASGDAGPMSVSENPEVVFVQRGRIEVRTPDAAVMLGQGDTMTVPMGVARSYASLSNSAQLVVVRGTG